MGCSSSQESNSRVGDEKADGHVEKKNTRIQKKNSTVDGVIGTAKAALLIQKFHRSRMARIRAQRKRTWQLLTAIEYREECSNIALSTFLHDVIAVAPNLDKDANLSETIEHEMNSIVRTINWEHIEVEDSYDGPRLGNGMTMDDVVKLVEFQRDGGVLHIKYVFFLMTRAKEVFMQNKSLVHISTAASHKMTVVGDIHGQYKDMLTIFHKNGYPSEGNPYLFNGDFVDRGEMCCEVAFVLFALKIALPNSVFVARGNHEELFMNVAYGFAREVLVKFQQYGDHAKSVFYLFGEVFRYIPLCHVIDNKVFCVHAGLCGRKDITLEEIANIQRHKHTKIGQASDNPADCVPGGMPEWGRDKMDRKIMQELMWSDPMSYKGCKFNDTRRNGCKFGPDFAFDFLDRNGLEMIVRSHEAVDLGYEALPAFKGRCITIFSASNYYQDGTNQGAYMVFTSDCLKKSPPRPKFVQYMNMDEDMSQMKHTARVGSQASSALKQLKIVIYETRADLRRAFEAIGKEVSRPQWAKTMAEVTGLSIAWLSLAKPLGIPDGDQINIASFIDQYKARAATGVNDASVDDTFSLFYKNRERLLEIFRRFDVDKSGTISKEEFSKGCAFLNGYLSTKIDGEQVTALFAALDADNDKEITMDEFLGGFTISI